MRTTPWTGVLAGVVLLAAACGGDEISERLIEDRIEAETGGDVDIDLDGDSGSFSVRTEDGSIEFDADGDGSFTVDGVDGGGGRFSVDSEDGVTVIETEDGDATIVQGGGDLPDGFPDAVVLPDGLDIELSQSMDAGDGQTGYLVIGSVDGGWESYFDELIASLQSAGFDEEQVTRTPTGGVLSYRRGDTTVFGNVGESGTPDETVVSLQVSIDG